MIELRGKVVHKYAFDINKREYEATLVLPDGARVVAFQVQRGLPCVWIEKNLDVPVMVTRRYTLVGTGHPINADLKHCGTVQMFDGDLVLHLYEERLLPT